MHSLKRTLIGLATLRLTDQASDWKSRQFGCVEKGRCSGLCTEFPDQLVVKAARFKVFRYFFVAALPTVHRHEISTNRIEDVNVCTH